MTKLRFVQRDNKWIAERRSWLSGRWGKIEAEHIDDTYCQGGPTEADAFPTRQAARNFARRKGYRL